MKKMLCLSVFLFGLLFCHGAEWPAAIQIREINLPLRKTPGKIAVTFPAVPAKKGFVPVLKGRFYYETRRWGGWNNNTKLFLNGKELKNKMPGGGRRLLYRGEAVVTAKSKRAWYAYGGWLFYFCNGERLSRSILQPKDEKCWYCFDVSDVINTSKPNTLTVQTKNLQTKFKEPVRFRILDTEVVYLPEQMVKRAAK